IKILFLCTGNSCRSQMAEGWARKILGNIVEPYSAGVEKHGLNPNAVKVMAEAGVDISKHYSKHVDELKGINFDYVITVCDNANESCPFFSGKTRVIHVGFEDPPRLAKNAKSQEEALNFYRRVRDQIRDFILKIPYTILSEDIDITESERKELQKRYFEILAQKWDDNPDHIAIAEAVYETIMQNLAISPQTKIFEYGCGTALISFLLAEKSGKVVVADNSEAMLEQVRKKITKTDSNLETIFLDLEKDEILKDEKFDLIISIMVLHHIENVEIILQKFNQMLCDIGKIFIVDLVKENGTFHSNIKVPHYGFDIEKLKEKLKSNGFEFYKSGIIHKIKRNNKDYPVFFIIAEKK
ncbi:MAG TPA: methyltransferase domain-containing protein, partial [Victivallales bacterium]|nr:methyltransferase domain-containing protein [Victivallales bacterium]